MKKLLFVFLSVIIMIGALSAVSVYADDAAAALTITPGDVVANACVFNVDVRIHVPEGTDISHMGFIVSVPDGLYVHNMTTCCVKGVFTKPETGDADPYKIIWDADGSLIPAGTDTVMCTLTFMSDEKFVLGNVYEIGLEADPENPTVNAAGEPVDVMFEGCSVEVVDHSTHVGDPNGDHNINLSDASIVMKHIAKWSDHICNSVQADVNNDGNINLSDASLLLKHIAKWNTARLGHNDAVETIKASTCKAEGETKLTCKNCGDSVTVVSKAVSCSYKKTAVTEPTCGKEGVDKYTCTMCGDSYTKTVKATGKHDYLMGICCTCGHNDGTAKVLTVGQKWTVAGQWEFTVTKVSVHRFCNDSVSADDEYFGGAQVVKVEYTCKNLGYSKNGKGLYVGAANFTVFDQKSVGASSYPCSHEVPTKRLAVGEQCKASDVFVLQNESDYIALKFSASRSDKSEKATQTFVLKITK